MESVEIFLQEQLKQKDWATHQAETILSSSEEALCEFDFGFQRSISREQMLRLSDCTWIDEAYNILFLGPPSA